MSEPWLADSVGPNMRVLICGLNPSVYSAESGISFGRPGNRFWPAALAAGLVSVDRDPAHALKHHGVGFTDLVKRPTRKASELEPHEYRDGLPRLDALAERYRPMVVCFVGLTGWRLAVDKTATAGWQARPVGPARAYLMASTSGLNAHASLDDLTSHLRVVYEACKNDPRS